MNSTLSLKPKALGPGWDATMNLRFIQKRERYILQQQMVSYAQPTSETTWVDVPLIKDLVAA